MLNGEIFRQRLKIANAHVVADTIDYLEANFSFLSNDWDGLDKWAHFAKDSAVYDIRLTDDCIRKEDHLNLSAGMWKVCLHGNEFRDGEVIRRITTDEAVLYVIPTGTLNGEPFPKIPASVTEQILARLDKVEQDGGGSGGPVGKVLVLVTGLSFYDYTGAYAAVTGGGAVELIVGGSIKVAEAREERKEKKRESGELETEADEP